MAYTQDQINQAFALRRAEGFTDQQINEMANNLGLTEQNVLDARKSWLGTDAGQDWLSNQSPLQQDWNKTFWSGDFSGAQDVLNRNKLTPSVLQSQYEVTPEEMSAVADRYSVYPFGVTPPSPTPSPSSQTPNLSNLPGAQVGPQQQIRAGFTYGTPTAEFGGWSNRYTKGAAGNQMLGAGNADYQSSLIKSLRQASANTPVSTNTGVTFAPSTTSVTPATFTRGTGNAFNPGQLTTTSPNTVTRQQETENVVVPRGGVGGQTTVTPLSSLSTNTVSNVTLPSNNTVTLNRTNNAVNDSTFAPAFAEDFGYVEPSSVPVVDRSVPSENFAGSVMSESLLPEWSVDAAFGVKSAAEQPVLQFLSPIGTKVADSLANSVLDSQIEKLANQYSAIEQGNNFGVGTMVDSSGRVIYLAPVETRDIFGGSYFPPESSFNAYDFGDLSGTGGGFIGFGNLDFPKQISNN